jgi:hypothetical protein
MESENAPKRHSIDRSPTHPSLRIKLSVCERRTASARTATETTAHETTRTASTVRASNPCYAASSRTQKCLRRPRSAKSGYSIIQFVPQVVVPDVSVRSLPLHDYTSSELTSADSGAMTYVATFPLSAVYVHRLALFSRGKADASRHCIRFPCQHAGIRLASIRCRFPCYQAGPPLRVLAEQYLL